jgi:hypothetical protein
MQRTLASDFFMELSYSIGLSYGKKWLAKALASDSVGEQVDVEVHSRDAVARLAMGCEGLVYG